MNISSKELTAQQNAKLNKGLNYVPTFENNKFNFMTDFQRFSRKLRLKLLLADKQKHVTKKDTIEINPKLQTVSSFDPIISNSRLESFQQVVINEVLDKWDSVKPPKNNLKKPERIAIREIKQDKSLIVKKADKGGATVIMDYHKYIEESEKQLNDSKVYKRLSKDPTNEIKKQIDEIINDVCDSSTISKIKSILINDCPRVPISYILYQNYIRIQNSHQGVPSSLGLIRFFNLWPPL